MATTLSTCRRCGGTITLLEGSGWWHTTTKVYDHRAEPDDSHVSGPSRDDLGLKECCDAGQFDVCEPDCDCDDCENERALDEDADAYAGRMED